MPSDAATGMRLAQMGRLADALPYLEAANRAAPADIPLLNAVASVLQWAGRGADAAERFRVAASLLPEDTIVLTGWARSLILIGKHDEAHPLLDKAVEIDPHFADAGGLLDMLLWENQDADAACLLLKPLVEKHPAHAELALQYAKALMAAEQLDDARAAYEVYQGLCPQDPLASVELGRLAASRGESAQAMQWFRSALAINPDYPPTLWEMAQANDWRLDPQTVAQIERLTHIEHDAKGLAGLHDILARQHDRRGEFRDRHSMPGNRMHSWRKPYPHSSATTRCSMNARTTA